MSHLAKKRLASCIRLCVLGLLAVNTALHAQAPIKLAQLGDDWLLGGQATYIWQRNAAFNAPYSSTNSLRPEQAQSYSLTTTAFIGYRAGNTELFFNPEASQGVALSGLTGLGGFTNGELARTSGDKLTVYRARLFARHTINDAGETTQLEREDNQFSRVVGKRRWVIHAGNLSVLDVFDDNVYSHDPRTQFMNWSLMTHGAYDYAADSRGYSWGVALERYWDNWTLRGGRFLQPKEPNQLALNPRILHSFGDQFELERAHRISGLNGKVRLLWFKNMATMARFDEATAQGLRTHTTPTLDAVRANRNSKVGYGVNMEQALGANWGAFFRTSKSDGQTETYAFTEIDRSTSLGLSLCGAAWGRDADRAGFGFVKNDLSGAHRAYLAAGGMGFFIGDGRINYKAEQIMESFIDISIAKKTWLGLNIQRISNPAYNADRGPVQILGLRLHLEF